MISLVSLAARIRRDRKGSALIEFALLAPLVFGLMLGVLQLGMAMQAFNAMRASSAVVARYAAVRYQNDNEDSNDTLATYARSVAIASPYKLRNAGLSVSVTTPVTQRFGGAKELSLTLTYNVPSVLKVMGVNSIPLTYTRPMFVQDD